MPSGPGRVGRALHPDSNSVSRFAILIRNARLVASAARGSLAFVAAVQVLGAVMGGVVLLAAGRVIQGLTGDQADWGATWPWIAALAAFTTVSGVLSAIGSEQQRLISELVNMHTSERLISSAADVAFERFDSGGFYNRMRRATEGSRGSATSIVWGTLGATRTIIDAVVILVLLVAVVPIVIPIALAAYVPLYFASRYSNKVLHSFAWDVTESDRRRQYLASIFGDRATAREVRTFALGKWLGAAHTDLWNERLIGLRKVVKERIASAAIGSFVSSMMSAAALGLVAYLASTGDLTLAEAGVGILGVHRLSGTVTRLNGHIASLHQGGLHMRDYDNFIADAERERQLTTGLDVPESVDEIELRGVSFQYPDVETFALNDVDMMIRKGEVVALVGPNGSGKSTLMLVLSGLYKPTKGQVLWDGIDASKFDPVQLSGSVAPMFQDFTRYQLTARENIVVSDLADAANAARVDAAVEAADAGSVIARLEHGLDTPLSRAYTEGTELSAGQWQRLAVARALFHNGPLLILDEPSADLDALAERELIDELADRAGERCILFISHRFSAVRRAHKIVVINDGRIVETGTHAELVAANGLYRAMFDSQTGEY